MNWTRQANERAYGVLRYGWRCWTFAMLITFSSSRVQVYACLSFCGSVCWFFRPWLSPREHLWVYKRVLIIDVAVAPNCVRRCVRVAPVNAVFGSGGCRCYRCCYMDGMCTDVCCCALYFLLVRPSSWTCVVSSHLLRSCVTARRSVTRCQCWCWRCSTWPAAKPPCVQMTAIITSKP